MRGRQVAAAVAGLLLLATTAAAQDAPTKGRVRIPAPPPAAAADNAVGDAGAGAQPVTQRPDLRPAVAPPPTLRSAIPWRWSQPATVARSTAGACRAQCSVSRLDCARGALDASACDPGWSRCLSSCSGDAYGRGP